MTKPLPNAALAELHAKDQEMGVDPFDDPGRGRAPGMPEVVAPLQQVGIPPADWRAEEAERAARP